MRWLWVACSLHRAPGATGGRNRSTRRSCHGTYVPAALPLLSLALPALALLVPFPVAAQSAGDLTGRKLTPSRDVHAGVESALGSLLAGAMTGDIPQVVVTGDEPTRLVVRVSYTGFDGGKVWVEMAGQNGKAQHLVQGSPPAPTSGESGDLDFSLTLSPGAPDNTIVKSAYLRVCVAKADRDTPSFVKTFDLKRTWTSGVRPENVVLTISPKPVGEAGKLGLQPTFTPPPVVLHPLPAAAALRTPIRTATLTPSSPAPAPSSSGTRGIAGMRTMSASGTGGAASTPPATRSISPRPMILTAPAAAKTNPATMLLAKNAAVPALSRYTFGVPPDDKQKGARGPAGSPVEPLGDLRAEDIGLDPSHVLAVFPSFYPDQNAASGIYYFLPYSYSLRWDQEDGYELHMIYSASGADAQAGSVAIAARLDAGLGIKERQVASDLIAAYARANGLAFTALRALPIDSLSISFSDDLRRYNIPADRIAVTGLSDYLGQIDVSWTTDPVTKENLQEALTEDVGINGRVKLYPSGGALAPIEVPIQIRLADFTTFGPFHWTRTGPWKNDTPYPVRLKYLNALLLDPSSHPVVYSWDLSDTRVPPEAHVNWAAASVPGWIDTQAKRVWLEYSVESNCQSCNDKVIASITGGASSTGSSFITFHTITPLADASAHEIDAQVRSRYFDPQSHDPVTKVVVMSADGKDFTVGPVFLGSRQPGESIAGDPLFEYFLEVTMADGTTYKATRWISGDDLRVSIGKHQVEDALGSLPGSH